MKRYKQIAKTPLARISVMFGVAAIMAFAIGSSRPKTAEDQIMEAFGLTSCQLTAIDQLDKSEMAITMSGQNYTIDYDFVSNRSKNFRLLVSTESGELEEIDAPPASTIRGILRGVEGSSVVGCVNEDGCCAKVTMPSGKMYFVEPVNSVIDDPAFADFHVIYSREDLAEAPKKCGCDTSVVEHNQPEAASSASEDTTASGIAEDTTLEVAELALEADFDFFSSARGGNSIRTTLDLMETALNFSNEQYGRAGVRHVVSDCVIRTTRAGNPWTTSNSGNLLSQLQTFYTTGDGVGTISGDLCHLFTGRSLTNNSGFSIAGTARVIGSGGVVTAPVVCTPSLAFALTTIQRSTIQQIATTFTHELGHNWSLNHCNCTGNIMNTPSNGGLSFTSGSVSQLVSTRNSLTCLDSIGSGGFGNNDNWNNLIRIDTPDFAISTRGNFNATTQRDEQNLTNTGSTLWWSVTPDSSGTIVIDTFGSDFDTQLHVYEFVRGSGFADLRLVDDDDDTSGLQSQVTFNVTAGTRYDIRVGGFRSFNSIGPGSQGNIVLNGSFTPADDCGPHVTVVNRVMVVTGTIAPDSITITQNAGFLDVNVNDDCMESFPMTGIDHIMIDGFSGADLIEAESVVVTTEIRGGSGADTIIGGALEDDIRGGPGPDVIFGGPADDLLCGGTGNDTVQGSAGNDVLLGANGTDSLFGGAGDDEIFGGIAGDMLVGGSGNDLLVGQVGNDVLEGQGGNDELRGLGGPDELFGGPGNDTLTGGEAFDLLDGGSGVDTSVDRGEIEIGIEN